MEKFYYFGIGRGERTVKVLDPIEIKNCRVRYFSSINNNKKAAINLLEEATSARGVLFGFGKTNKKITEFLSTGTFLSPKYTVKKTSIYFIDKLILIKINKQFKTFSSFKNQILKIIKPLKIASEKEYKNIQKVSSDEEGLFFRIESKKGIINASEEFNTFVLIKPKELKKVKDTLKKIYSEN